MSTKSLQEKDTSLIPIGHYCYKFDNLYEGEVMPGHYPTVNCPYGGYKDLHGVSMPYCSFLEEYGDDNNLSNEGYKKLIAHFKTDEAMWEVLKLDLLWDSCKECGENYEEDFNIDRDSKEDQIKLNELDEAWIKKIKKLRNG